MAMLNPLKQAGIEIPFPQRNVHVALEKADDPTGGREAAGSPRDR
jgi:small-conductance mechanosensitive channel